MWRAGPPWRLRRCKGANRRQDGKNESLLCFYRNHLEKSFKQQKDKLTFKHRKRRLQTVIHFSFFFVSVFIVWECEPWAWERKPSSRDVSAVFFPHSSVCRWQQHCSWCMMGDLLTRGSSARLIVTMMFHIMCFITASWTSQTLRVCCTKTHFHSETHSQSEVSR